MSDLIKESDLSNALQLEKLHMKIFAPALMKLLKLKKLNKAIEENEHLKGVEFVDHFLKQLKVEYEIDAEDLKNIPLNNSFIALANHPYGGIDGLILLSIFLKARPDFKVSANYLLQRIESVKENFIPVNPFENDKDKGKSISGLKKLLRHVKESPVGIFPAGEVSSIKFSRLKVLDKSWNPIVGKIIKKSEADVLPVFFSGNNSLIFNLLGLLNPNFRTAKLPSELFNKKQKVKVRIGKIISNKSISDFKDSDDMLNFLRAKTYALGTGIEVKKNFRATLKSISKPKAVIPAIDKNSLASEICTLKKTALLFSHQQYEIYICAATQIPYCLKEISRLREIAYREVGEGTNRSFDSDAFDAYYKHLFIWDSKAQCIVGAYRLGLGDELFAVFGKKGFYLNQLFKIQKEFNPYLQKSIELGRSFVTKEYQRKPLSLLLLWKGINEFLKKNPDRFKYMIGPVSISNSFSSLSKDLLVAYIRHNHYDRKLSKLIKARKKFKYKFKGEEGKSLIKKHSDDIKKLDNFISEIETTHLKIPVLIKKYLKLNAKIVSFNIDPKFNDSLDGFLILEIDQIPEKAFDMLIKN